MFPALGWTAGENRRGEFVPNSEEFVPTVRQCVPWQSMKKDNNIKSLVS